MLLLTISAIVVNSIFKKHKIDSLHQYELYSAIFSRIRDLEEPAFICDETGKVYWNNLYMQETRGRKSLVLGSYYSNFFDGDLINGTDLTEVNFEDKKYKVDRYSFPSNGQTYYLFIFRDITDKVKLEKELKDTDKIVAHIVIDNLEELLQFEPEKHRNVSAKVGDLIRKWANTVNGIVTEYERDKYIFFFDAQHLETFRKETLDTKAVQPGEFDEPGFNILKKVRNILVGAANVPVTLSIGIANVAGTIAEKERASHACLETALQRGGDQAVVRDSKGTKFYGAKCVATQRRSRVRARVVASELIKHIDAASNVIIMGHKFPDYDAIGAAIGIAKLCKRYGARYNIVTNLEDINFLNVKTLLDENEWDGVFVHGALGLDLVKNDTLLVLVDVNSFNMLECSDILTRVDNYFIIDHHRKANEFHHEPIMAYIETSASSASELVTEMIEQVSPEDTLTPNDAKILFAGISLDTKQFTKNTGSKTYGAAMFLRDLGANYDSVADLFKSPLEDFKLEAKYSEDIEIYNDNIAIVKKVDNTTKADKILAAKVTDNLLKITNIEASFSLVKIDDVIYVSARSCGRVNVHLILEELGGGGHFNVAGGQFNKTMKEVVESLKKAIDKHTKREE